MADEILRLQLDACIAARTIYPGSTQHIWLMHAWMSRDAARRGPLTADVPEVAAQRTFGFALLEWPACARALGHYVIEIEQPIIPKLLPEYAREAAEFAQVIEQFQRSGRALERYRAMNPGTSAILQRDGSLMFVKDEPDVLEVESHRPPPAPVALPPPPAPPVRRMHFAVSCLRCQHVTRGEAASEDVVRLKCSKCGHVFDYTVL
jgi:hypothetical protein